MEENNQENLESTNESLENMQEPNTKPKGLIIVLAILIILLIVGGGFGFYFLSSQIDNLERDLDVEKQKVEDQVEDTDTTDDEVVINEEETDEEEEVDEPEPQPTEIDYYNQKYGFGMTFPLTWENYDVTESQTNWGELKAQSLYFGFDDQKELFAISIFTKDQWDKLQDLPDRRQVTYLDENSQYVFAWSHSQYLENDEMEKRAKEIPEIIESFYTDAK